MGVNYIEGCCGCKATHLREMARAPDKFDESRVWNRREGHSMSETEHNRAYRESLRG
jgi:hypothetical protein